MHIAHEPNPLGAHITACGQPWQNWQAPEVYADGHLGVLPGPDEPPDVAPVACPVCAAELARWVEEAPLRERAAEQARIRAEAQADVANRGR